MANQNTRYSRKHGFCSQKDMLAKNDNRIFKGSTCATHFGAPGNKRRARKVYKRKEGRDE